ncbi:NADPH-dependent FMN reductase [Mesorhizobium opportunistum]|uniref:NADPH-dependent FMN reductase n=1 Tax=Mesorhizobium opportunistum TaxID=593909 RepID=UPI003334A8A8
MFRTAVVVGSIRANSLNRKIAEILIGMESEGLGLHLVEIGRLPLYNEDLEGDPPSEWQKFRASMTASNALLFVTPEHNRSVPAALKNAIDVGSRPFGASVWEGKPAGVITVSPGAIGGFGANHHLRQMFVFLNVLAMQQPEAYLGGASEFFDQNGALAAEETRKFLNHFMKAYAEWVNRSLAPPQQSIVTRPIRAGRHGTFDESQSAPRIEGMTPTLKP